MIKKIIIALFIVISLLGCLFYFIFIGKIRHNEIYSFKYKVKGLDISNHQASIDWNKIDTDKYSFVFIKATEGTGFTDHMFEENWNNSKSIGLLRSAYHFFHPDISGKKQAEHFLSIFPEEEKTLPPIVDVEIGEEILKEKFLKELHSYINEVEEKTNQEVIIYTLNNYYENYIKDNFDNPIWIRDIWMHPKLDENKEWTFWQYSNRGIVKGIEGYTDLNFFSGSEEDLNNMEE